MKRINIVLLNPEIPQNTGNISRTCAVTGAALHIVYPIGFEISDRTLKRAGLDYWDKLDITYYENAEEFFRIHGDKQLWLFSTKAPRSYAEVEYPEEVWLMFGPETRGLPEDLLASREETCVRLPMREGLRSLNLSNTVAVAVYEALRQRNFEGLLAEGEPTTFSWKK